MADGVGSESSPKIRWKAISTFQKFYEIFKWTGAIAALALAGYSKCESELANRKADKAPQEKVTKAAFDEMAKKLNDLAHDMNDKEKAFFRTLNRVARGFDKRATSAEAKAESVRSLFIGHALASSRASSRTDMKKNLVNLTKSINEAAEKTESAGAKPISMPKPTRRFRPARKYQDIKQQQQKRIPQVKTTF
jgi:hypothetical protein